MRAASPARAAKSTLGIVYDIAIVSPLFATIIFGNPDPPMKILNPCIPIFFLAAPLLYAQEPAAVAKKSPIALLPNGSVLHGVLLPRYDAQRRLVGDLKTETMTLVDGDRIQGENVLIRFYNPDRTLSGRVELTRALFNQAKSTLSAKQDVKLIRDGLSATGDGLVYSFSTGEGFLIGPVSTRLSPPPLTTMNTNPLALPAIAMLAFAPAISQAAPPAYVSPEELAEINNAAKSAEPKITAANQSVTKELSADNEAAAKVTANATAFIEKNNIKPVANSGVNQEEAKPLEIEPGPEDTVIDCDGGMYFDAEEGVLVYLKNVRVKDPRFTLDGANELKIFFDKKKPAEKKPKEAKGAGPTANFGDVKKLIATGAVKILQKGVDGKAPVEASGALLNYDVQSGEIIISGGYPWVRQDKFFARAKEPNLTLRLLTDGSFSTKGNWQMGGNLNLKGN